MFRRMRSMCDREKAEVFVVKAHRLSLIIAVIQIRQKTNTRKFPNSNLSPRERTCLQLQKIRINAAAATTADTQREKRQRQRKNESNKILYTFLTVPPLF